MGVYVHVCMYDVCMYVFVCKVLLPLSLLLATIALYTRGYTESLTHDKLLLLLCIIAVVVTVVQAFLLFTHSMSKVFTFKWNELILNYNL